MIPILVAAAVSAAGAMASNTAATEGAHDAYISYKKNAAKAMNFINAGYDKAISFAKEYTDKAQKYQDPYVELGTDAKAFFDQYQKQTGATMANLYEKYGKTGDTLYDYWQGKQSKALDRRLAAIGKYGSGAGTEAHVEQESSLSAKMAELTDTRVARELATRMQLLGIGKSAADISTNLQSTLGYKLGEYEIGRGRSLGGIQTGIGEASAQSINAQGASKAQMIGQLAGIGSWATMAGANSIGKAVTSFAGGDQAGGLTQLFTGTGGGGGTPLPPQVGPKPQQPGAYNNAVPTIPSTTMDYDSWAMPYSVTGNEYVTNNQVRDWRTAKPVY